MKRSRQKVFPERIDLRTTTEQAKQIEEWQAKQRPIPGKNEAIRRLIDLGLANDGDKKTDRRTKK